jgi:hypothetical protein
VTLAGREREGSGRRGNGGGGWYYFIIWRDESVDIGRRRKVEAAYLYVTWKRGCDK